MCAVASDKDVLRWTGAVRPPKPEEDVAANCPILPDVKTIRAQAIAAMTG